MNTIQDSPEFIFCEAIINRLRENENLRPLVLEQPYDRDDQTQKLALANRQYDGTVAVMPAGLGMDWQGADNARVRIWTARAAILVMVTAKTEEDSGLRRSSALLAEVIRTLSGWDPDAGDELIKEPWFVGTADLMAEDVADLETSSEGWSSFPGAYECNNFQPIKNHGKSRNQTGTGPGSSCGGSNAGSRRQGAHPQNGHRD